MFIPYCAGFRAMMMAARISGLSISLVSTLVGGAPQFEKLPEMLRFGIMVAFANTSLALLAVSGDNPDYWSGFLPGLVIMGVGMTVAVPPLTTTVLPDGR